jgi:DNA-binding MarR family transcriptional regulator
MAGAIIKIIKMACGVTCFRVIKRPALLCPIHLLSYNRGNFGMISMKLSQLRTFVAVADNGGVARAAARLNLTQSAASRQISALEIELGVPLFDRVGRRVQLTSEGEDLLRRSRRLLGDAEALGERARALTTGRTGPFASAPPHR